MNGLLVAVLAWYAVRGTFKGFVKSAFSLLCVIITLFSSFMLAGEFAKVLLNVNFLEKPIGVVVEKTLNALDEELANREFSSTDEVLGFLDNKPLPLYAKSVLKNACENIFFDGKKTLFLLVKNYFYNILIKIISFLFIFAIIYLFLWPIQRFLIRRLRGTSFVVTNRVLGFLLGTVKGVVVYGTIVILLAGIGKFVLSDFILQKIQQGGLSSIIYDKFGEKFVSWFVV